MKIEQLRADLTFKNYIELCRFLDEPVKSGHSKKAQISEMERFFRYAKNGHSYTIEEVYDKPLEKQDGRTKTIYGHLIEAVLLLFLAEKRGYLLVRTNYFFDLLGLVNTQYAEFIYTPSILAKKLRIDKKVVSDFYNDSRDKFIKMTDAALNRMVTKNLIEWEKAVIYEDNEGVLYMAEPIQSEIIKSAEKKVIIDEEVDLHSVILNNKYPEFMEKVCKIIRQYPDIIPNIRHFYRAYSIKLISGDDQKESRKEDIIEITKQLNNTVVHEFKQCAEKNQLISEYIKILIDYIIKRQLGEFMANSLRI